MSKKAKKTWFRARAAGRGVGEISIFSDIGEFGVSAGDFYAALQGLGNVSTLKIAISSNGGDVSAGMAIFNMLKRHKARKVITIEGLAASMASVIAMAGDEIVMPRNSMMMIHNPWGGVVGEGDQIISFGEALQMMQAEILNAYHERTKQPESKLSAMMNRETWLSAERAVELGFADTIEEPMAMAASIDIAKFKRAPKSFRATMRKVNTMPKKSNANNAANSEFEEGADDTAMTAEEVRAAVLAQNKEVRSLCALAGLPDMADKFIEDDTPVSDVIEALAKAKADKSKSGGKNGKKTGGDGDEEVSAHNSGRHGGESTGRELDPVAAMNRFNNPPKAKR